MRKVVNLGLSIAMIAVCFSTATVEASILAQVGPKGFGTITNSEDFESYGAFDSPGQPFSSSGFTFDLPDFDPQTTIGFVIWEAGGDVGHATQSLYQDGGAYSMTSIALSSNADIEQIEFDVANGYGRGPQNVWVRAYNNGAATGFDFAFNTLAWPSTISVWTNGTVFDEIRVQSYIDSNSIQGNESQFGAASIDNVKVGTLQNAIPEPGSLLVWGVLGLASVGLTNRRRK
jgi:hypothetical protein